MIYILMRHTENYGETEQLCYHEDKFILECLAKKKELDKYKRSVVNDTNGMKTIHPDDREYKEFFVESVDRLAV